MRRAARPSKRKINSFRGCGDLFIVVYVCKQGVPRIAEQHRFASRENSPREVFLTMFNVTRSKIDVDNALGTKQSSQPKVRLRFRWGEIRLG